MGPHEVHGQSGLVDTLPGSIDVPLAEQLALLPVFLPELAVLATALPGAASAVILPVHPGVAGDADREACPAWSSHQGDLMQEDVASSHRAPGNGYSANYLQSVDRHRENNHQLILLLFSSPLDVSRTESNSQKAGMKTMTTMKHFLPFLYTHRFNLNLNFISLYLREEKVSF